MDDELRDEDSVGDTPKWSSYVYMWLFRPLLHGFLFGLGHYLSYRIIAPFFTRQLAVKSS